MSILGIFSQIKEPAKKTGSYPHKWGIKTATRLIVSAPGTIRTRNPLIRSQMLCPLSYGGVCLKLYSTEGDSGLIYPGLRLESRPGEPEVVDGDDWIQFLACQLIADGLPEYIPLAASLLVDDFSIDHCEL